ALTGITRDSVITIARELGYEVQAKRLTRDDIYIADEAFFTGTAAEVTPIRELDDRVIGAGSRGPVTQKIQARYFDSVNGRAPEYGHWLPYVCPFPPRAVAEQPTSPWWLPGAHLQTLYPLLRKPAALPLRRERVELPDGDFIDID